MIEARLRKNYKHKKKWAKRNQIEAFRLYEKDIPEFPYIIDIYKNKALVYFKGNDEIDKDKMHHKDEVIEALQNILEVDKSNIIFKERKVTKRTEQYNRIKKTFLKEVVLEHGTKVLVNLKDYIDTGLFLDHRPIRQTINKDAKDKKFLNLFCYTGVVSVFAALGGATVTSVDMSNTYMNWAKENFVENDIELNDHKFIVQNAMEFIKHDRDVYDLIFLDPPTFSNSKKMEDTFDVERDQLDLINHTMELLSNEGVLYFSNNKRRFKLVKELTDKYSIEDIGAQTIPEDFRDKRIHNCYKITHKRES